MTSTKHIVELEKNTWLAELEGDPGRTVIKSNAQQFDSHEKAEAALGKAITENPHRNGFKNAKILEVRP